jgi:hypothetical protein
MDETIKTTSPSLEAATVYLLPQHQIILEELKLKLRRQGIKGSKSKLARVAINLLGDLPLEKIITGLEQDTAE